jgi:hypothetical protein
LSAWACLLFFPRRFAAASGKSRLKEPMKTRLPTDLP